MKREARAAIFGPMRLPFLILTPACVSLGAAVAVYLEGQINLGYLVLAFIGALSAHISVNAFNEYFDFRSGLDFNTSPTPFSGGSGALPENPEKAHISLITAALAFTITIVIGIYFLRVRGLGILPFGLLGLILIITYTKWLTHSPFLCLIAPGLGFGPLMVMGTAFVLTGSYSWSSFMSSLVPFFLVSNLLLLNQFPDVEADQIVGRRHLPIVLGKSISAKIYIIFLTCAYISVIIGCFLRLLPLESFLALASIILAIPTALGVVKYAQSTTELVPYLGKNVIIVISTTVLLAISIFLGA